MREITDQTVVLMVGIVPQNREADVPWLFQWWDTRDVQDKDRESYRIPEHVTHILCDKDFPSREANSLKRMCPGRVIHYVTRSQIRKELYFLVPDLGKSIEEICSLLAIVPNPPPKPIPTEAEIRRDNRIVAKYGKGPKYHYSI